MSAATNPSDRLAALDQFKSAIAGIEIVTDPTQLAKLSQDYHHFSPILSPQLGDKVGDLVVRPADQAEVLRIAQACVQTRLPLTIRGAGTGNYGQCVPLQGGVILDMTRLNQIRWLKPGAARVEAGIKLATLDRQAQPTGWELRMLPSTFRTATLGGFIAGGSGGIGSINYGLLADRGNLHALRVVTLEETPRVLELRGDEVQQVNHAWGINGIITEVELPLAPAYPWAEAVVCFQDFMDAARFGRALAVADGLVKKLICVCAWPIPVYFGPLQGSIPNGSHCALLMVAESSVELLQGLVREHNGRLCYQKSAQEASKGLTVAEFSWNHTTLHARSVDPTITYLQTLFPNQPNLDLIEHCYHHFGEEVMMHLEFIRANGSLVPAALQLVRFTNEARLNEIIRYHEEQGAFIANPHVYIIEDGGRKQIDPAQLRFKQQMDPYGLLNPGKLRAWEEQH